MRLVTSRRPRSAVRSVHGFTLIELLVVMGIIVLAMAFLIPALTPASGRSIEGAARQFMSDLENARQIAIAERTKTRVLIPDVNPSSGSFGGDSADLGLRAYTIVSFNKSANTWKQRGKWTRLSQSAVLDPRPSPSPSPPEQAVIPARRTATTTIDNSLSGTAASQDFTGAYIEFRSNGSASLDPNAPQDLLVIADGIADGNGNMTPKDKSLRYRITIDPLSGSARLQ